MLLYVLESKADLSDILDAHRNAIDDPKVTFSLDYNIKFYTNITIGLLDMCSKQISAQDMDRLLVAYDVVMRAVDAVGIQRALGSRYVYFFLINI